MSNLKYYAAFDTETSDLPENSGKIIEFACLLADIKSKQEVASCQIFMYLEAGETMSPEAFKKHGRTQEWLKENGVSRKEGRQFFLEWLLSYGVMLPRTEKDTELSRQLLPVGQNIAFDIKMVTDWIGKERMGVFTFRVKDTMAIADFLNDCAQYHYGYDAILFRDPITGHPSASLEAQARHFGLDITQAHGALWDCRTAFWIWKQHLQNFVKK